jgi:hypothetical protein
LTTTAPAPPDLAAADNPPPRAIRGGTRWRRSGILFIPAIVALAVLAIAVLQGVLALNLVVSGQDFKITSNGARVDTPRGLTMYPSTIRMKNGGQTRGIVIAGLPEADLTKGMCISLVLTFPVAGTYTVQLHTSGRTVAKDMTIDASGLDAGVTDLVPRTTDGRAGNGANVVLPVSIGKNAADLDGVKNGPQGRFAIEAPGNGSLTGLRADAEGAIIAGTAKLSGLSVHIHHGRGTSNGECY